MEKRTLMTYSKNAFKVEDKIKKFNRKLAKYGREEVVEYTISEPYKHKCELGGKVVVVELVDIEITDITVSLNTMHRVVAKIEMPTKEDTVVTMINRDKYKVEDFQHIKEITCDHCKSKRRRKKGFILENVETGELLNVGATCMKDYTQDLSIMAKMKFHNELYDEFLFDEMDYVSNYFSSNDWVTIEDVVAYTNRVVKEDGEFISINDSMYTDKKATKDRVEVLSLSESTITEEEKEEVNKMLDVIKSCEIEKIMDNHFNIELLDLIKNGWCKINQIGKAVWIHQLYNNIVEYVEKEEIKTINEYFGQVGNKTEVKLKSISNIWVDTYYGSTCMNKFVDEENRVFVWWTKKEINTNGEFKNIRFTIKNHNEYNGEKQTVITRAKVID